ncbi:MAG: MogA/MoaB family molybdenum cofactor biosynthesis protein [Pirellulales bacterium]|nr:MogA/MoaB family molybdenum cofactor biosynthesis protein [Pirellulales bacterium]
MTDTVAEHRQASPPQVRCGVVTVSDTRTLADDRGGGLIVELLSVAGHTVAAREIVPDDPALIGDLVIQWRDREDIDAILLTGGTGISRRDQTFETVEVLLTKVLTGYGELFRVLSYQEIGAAAMLSRALGGVAETTVVLTMPGSPNAVRLAMEKLILPELRHLVREATR